MKLQSLPPHLAKMCLRTEKRSGSALPPLENRHLLLALSGGSDSLALGLIFHFLKERLSLKLSAMHINHGLRQEANLDADCARDFCLSLNIPFTIQKIDIPAKCHELKCGIEEGGRILRNNALEVHRQAIGADFILTAHHRNDLAEDIILRMLRGAAWPALGGMKWKNGNFLRPLLHESKENLRSLVEACSIKWREDKSNQSLTFKRNRIRHVLLPIIRCENPAIEETCVKMHSQAERDADYWQHKIKEIIDNCPYSIRTTDHGTELTLNGDMLRAHHPALRMRLFNHALLYIREALDLNGQNREEAIVAIEEAFNRNTGGKRIECSGGISAVMKNGNVVLETQIAASRTNLNKSDSPCHRRAEESKAFAT